MAKFCDKCDKRVEKGSGLNISTIAISHYQSLDLCERCSEPVTNYLIKEKIWEQTDAEKASKAESKTLQ